MPGAKLCFWTSAAGIAEASALPAAEKVNPATPNAGTAALVTRFFFEACFIRGMVASSDIARRIFPQSYADKIRHARFMGTRKRIDAGIHIYERYRRIFVTRNRRHPSRLNRVRLGAVRNCLPD